MDWLNNIYCSEFVITDSFHGVAFCLIYKKNFVVLCANKEKFTRLESLLKKVNLQTRVIQSLEDLHQREDILFEKIDYTKVDEILNQERKIYKEFLLKVIK
jgi:exopolysaccharide biosynthesis predicted pyruvyltransferase EpsI